MPKTKTLYHHVVYYNWITGKYVYTCDKEIFYLDLEDPNDGNYYYNNRGEEHITEKEIGKVFMYENTYYLYTRKISKQQVINIFREYIWDRINQFRKTEEEKLHAIEETLLKEEK